jgi:DUF4097 and DUF4098 domain-containing protein YvlB
MVALGLAGLAASACVVDMQGLHVTDGLSLNEKAERVETRPLALAPGATLTFDAGFGDVTVATSDDGRAELTATIRARGRTRAEAEAVLARYALALEDGPDGPMVRLVGEPLRVEEGRASAQLGAHADFEAVVPDGTRLVAHSGSGDLLARGALGACRLETSYGDIAAEGVRGDLVAKCGSGDVIAADVEGGSIELTSGYGQIQLAGARATRIRIESGSGDIALEDAHAGTLALETSYGDVHVRAAHGALRARSGSGEVRLHGVHGALDAESGYGALELDGVFSALTAASGSGDVFARARAGSTPDAAWKLHSGYGSVTLAVPDGFGCTLEARTSYGDVDCDFPITIEADQLEKRGTLRGTVRSGAGSVTLSSGSGDVALRKLR